MKLRFEDVVQWFDDPLPDETPDLIPGILPRHGQLVIIGTREVGKSLTALEIASSLLTGEPLWGKFVPLERAKRVVYFLGEHHGNTLMSLWRHMHLWSEPRTMALIGPQKFQDRRIVAHGVVQQEVLDNIKRFVQGAGLAIFDPLAAFVMGSNAENDNVAMRALVDGMTQTVNNEGAACLILGHEGKPMIEHGTEYKRETQRTRGASAIEDAATSLFYLEQDKHNIFKLLRKKYKGEQPQATTEVHLRRDPETLRQFVKDSAERAATDLKKLEFCNRLSRLLINSPTMDRTEAIELLAKIEGISRATAFRYLDVPE